MENLVFLTSKTLFLWYESNSIFSFFEKLAPYVIYIIVVEYPLFAVLK